MYAYNLKVDWKGDLICSYVEYFYVFIVTGKTSKSSNGRIKRDNFEQH
jgi:hypothetical protein